MRGCLLDLVLLINIDCGLPVERDGGQREDADDDDDSLDVLAELAEELAHGPFVVQVEL